MIRPLLIALASHWRRHPGQLLTLVLGLSLATALWTGVQAINSEARASYAAAAQQLGQNTLTQLEAPNGRIDQSVFVDLRRAGWLVAPVLEGRLRVGDETIRLRGYDPLTTPLAAQTVDLQAPDALAAFVQGRVGYLHPDTLAGLDPAQIDLDLQAQAGLPLGILFADIGTAQRLLRAEGQLSALLLWPTQPEGLPPLAEIAPGLRETAPQATSETAALTDSFHLNLTAFGLLSFAVGLFIVHAAIGLAFEQRRQMFRTLRALGVPTRKLITVLGAEVLALALIAGALGVALGYVIAASLLPNVAATLRGLYGAEVAGTVALRPAWWLSGLAIAVLGAGAAAGQSLWRVARLPVLAPAQPRAWLRASERGLRIQAGLALACLAVSAVALWAFSGLIAGFVMLGALLIGSALLLPVALSLVLGLGARLSRGPLATWFWADTRHQLPGLSLALMALMLALATNIGVGTMVSSFRLTFTGWLDQRLASEFYVTGRDQAEADALRAFLETEADAVLPIWRIEGPLAGAPGEVFAVADHPTYRDNWPLLLASPDVWDGVARGQGVLINEQLWRRSGLDLGAALMLPGGGAPLPVLGVYSDYGNPKAQAMLGVAQFDARYPDAARLGYAVRVPPAQVAALRSAIRDRFDLPDTLMIDQAQVKAFSLGVFERTFAVSAALNVLTLGVAAFAMLTSFLTLAGMRLPQLAPIWALGLTRAGLARLELVRAVLLAVLTAIVALPVGLALAWCLLAVVNVEAFGWRLPMFLFPAQWVWLGALALLAAVLAALWPVRRLATTPPGHLLKVFANER
jgi:putative ABC transport system permease protein